MLCCHPPHCTCAGPALAAAVGTPDRTADPAGLAHSTAASSSLTAAVISTTQVGTLTGGAGWQDKHCSRQGRAVCADAGSACVTRRHHAPSGVTRHHHHRLIEHRAVCLRYPRNQVLSRMIRNMTTTCHHLLIVADQTKMFSYAWLKLRQSHT
jgi:hypothetical protein